MFFGTACSLLETWLSRSQLSGFFDFPDLLLWSHYFWTFMFIFLVNGMIEVWCISLWLQLIKTKSKNCYKWLKNTGRWNYNLYCKYSNQVFVLVTIETSTAPAYLSFITLCICVAFVMSFYWFILTFSFQCSDWSNFS